MAISVSVLKEWLDTLAEDDSVFIDDGGLTLCSEKESLSYLEVGGMYWPEPDLDEPGPVPAD